MQDIKERVDLLTHGNQTQISSLLREVFNLYVSFRNDWAVAEDAWAREVVKNKEMQEREDKLVAALKEIIASDECHEIWYHAVAKEALQSIGIQD
jgi:hypothetical protein